VSANLMRFLLHSTRDMRLPVGVRALMK